MWIELILVLVHSYCKWLNSWNSLVFIIINSSYQICGESINGCKKTFPCASFWSKSGFLIWHWFFSDVSMPERLGKEIVRGLIKMRLTISSTVLLTGKGLFSFSNLSVKRELTEKRSVSYSISSMYVISDSVIFHKKPAQKEFHQFFRNKQ